ncbi:hypothetical protein WR25_09335 [Diploscapter pachys]|uniref:CHK kinase-like domain-containing protein n=1 Tax=Diploscapter pachys TaxID=2018661 RepID=A0A2A2L5E1_9BILA|nr:hypothetical protein WR25_09335 [Diploscapter pachys]
MASLKPLPDEVWKLVETDLQRHYGTESELGQNRHIERLGEGQGFSSEMCLLHPDWVRKDDQILPDKFVLKMTRKFETPKKEVKSENEEKGFGNLWKHDSDEKLNMQSMKIHNTEALVLSKLKEKRIQGIAMPKVISVGLRPNVETVGYILMEFVHPTAKLHMCDNVPEHGVDQVLRSLANIEAAGYKLSEEEKSKFNTQIWNGPFKILFEKNVQDGFIEAIRKNISGKWPQVSEDLIRIYLEMDQKYLDFVEDTNKLLGIPNVLCHGDVWICNMLWNNENPDAWRLEALIDYQACYFGCAAVDLARLYTGLIGGEERRTKAEIYNKRFYAYLEEALQKDDIPLPYTFEQLQEAYHRVFPLCALVVGVSMAGVGHEIVAKSTDPEKAKERLDEKHLCILEDLILEHQRNLEIMKETNYSS